ncbi:hypothetical protein [Saccharomonospora xinjiangensis]|nr:hypothetical protein [Saccharomonospora xinjiangensis]
MLLAPCQAVVVTVVTVVTTAATVTTDGAPLLLLSPLTVRH